MRPIYVQFFLFLKLVGALIIIYLFYLINYYNLIIYLIIYYLFNYYYNYNYLGALNSPEMTVLLCNIFNINLV